jgi:hypothetical protein
MSTVQTQSTTVTNSGLLITDIFTKAIQDCYLQMVYTTYAENKITETRKRHEVQPSGLFIQNLTKT